MNPKTKKVSFCVMNSLYNSIIVTWCVSLSRSGGGVKGYGMARPVIRAKKNISTKLLTLCFVILLVCSLKMISKGVDY